MYTCFIVNSHCVCPPDWSKFFKAASDPQRQTILTLIQEKEALNVSQLVEAMELSQPTVSHHLKIMVEAGLLMVTKSGKESVYTIRPDQIQECCSGFMDTFAPENESKTATRAA